MQNLIQYVDLITQFKPKKEEIALVMGGKDTKLFEFFEGIANKQFKTEGDAAKHLYNKTINYPAYKTLKSELKKRLINVILTLDYKQPVLNDIQQAYYTCQKNWAAINILSGRYQATAAIDLAQTTLNLALKYEITETVVNTSRLLVYLYRIYYPLHKRIREYEKIYLANSEILAAENLSFNYYDDLSKNFIRIRATQKHLHEKSILYYKELSKYLDKNSSHRLYFTTSLIRLISFTCINDYKGALKVIDEAILYFDKKPFEVKTQLTSLLHQKIACCIQLKLYEEGKAAANRSLNMVQKGTYNWYRDRLLFIQFCLHTHQYQEGWKTIIEVISHGSFNTQSIIIKDEVNIYLSYLKYLMYHSKIKASKKEKEIVEKFDLSGYINIAPSFHKDKRGMNISSLISQILWLLADKDYQSIHFRTQALDKYITRHINKEAETYRTNLFIKMLNTMEKCDFRRRRVEQKTRKLFNELKNTAININNNALKTEVLPYEVTWELMLNAMT